MSTGLGRFFAACLVAAASLGMIDQARAAAYVGAWDPLYGAPFTDLGWRGTATFQVPLSPPCNTTGVACTGGAYVQGAQVTFYDTQGTASTLDDTDLATITWSTAELAAELVNALEFDVGGALKYVDTTPFDYKAPTLLAGFDGVGFGGFAQDEFSLQFVIDQEVAANALFSGPRLYWTAVACKDEDEDEDDCRSGSNDVLGNPPQNFTITRVPEPASLALVMAALLAAGATQRRSRKS